MSRKIAIYSNTRDKILRESVRDGVMKLGLYPSFLKPSLFSGINTSAKDHGIAVVPALHGKCAEIAHYYGGLGTPVLLVGDSLFEGLEDVYRVSPAVRGWIPKLQGPSSARMSVIGNPKVKDKPRVKSQPIVVLGQRPELDLDAETLRKWTLKTIDLLKNLTEDKVIWRPHEHNAFRADSADEVSDPKSESLDLLLDRAWLVVSHSAPRSLQALLAGRAVINDESSPYADVTYRMNQFGKVAKPTDETVEPLLNALSYLHYTKEEIESGEAMSSVLRYLSGDSPPVDKPASNPEN